MERVLIHGVESVVGANFAAHLADRCHVIGTSSIGPVTIAGCETIHAPSDDVRTVREILVSHRPDRIVECGVAGDSPWHRAGAGIATPSAIASARGWARVAGELGIRQTLISSDAVFNGPWMFHAEESTAYCGCAAAQALLGLESSILAENSGCLVVRTHAYGWAPFADELGWIEGIVAALESEQACVFDCVAHATPILATDLADVLQRAWSADLSGRFHVAGAERTNLHRFVYTLATLFDLAPRRSTALYPPAVLPAGLAQGETSLQTRAIRQVLGIAMPLLADGLTRLRDQRVQGFDRRLCGNRRFVPGKVA